MYHISTISDNTASGSRLFGSVVRALDFYPGGPGWNPIRDVGFFSNYASFEPPRGKTNNLHRRKQRRRSASRVTAKLISAFVFATRIVQFLCYLNPKFQASSSFLCLYRLVCVGPVRKPYCWFSNEAAHFLFTNFLFNN